MDFWDSLKNPAVKFLELLFFNNFLSSIIAKRVRDENCRVDFPTDTWGQ